jgi:hypothetical protein
MLTYDAGGIRRNQLSFSERKMHIFRQFIGIVLMDDMKQSVIFRGWVDGFDVYPLIFVGKR